MRGLKRYIWSSLTKKDADKLSGLGILSISLKSFKRMAQLCSPLSIDSQPLYLAMAGSCHSRSKELAKLSEHCQSPSEGLIHGGSRLTSHSSTCTSQSIPRPFVNGSSAASYLSIKCLFALSLTKMTGGQFRDIQYIPKFSLGELPSNMLHCNPHKIVTPLPSNKIIFSVGADE